MMRTNTDIILLVSILFTLTAVFFFLRYAKSYLRTPETQSVRYEYEYKCLYTYIGWATSILSFIVVFLTTYTLFLPALSLAFISIAVVCNGKDSKQDWKESLKQFVEAYITVFATLVLTIPLFGSLFEAANQSVFTQTYRSWAPVLWAVLILYLVARTVVSRRDDGKRQEVTVRE